MNWIRNNPYVVGAAAVIALVVAVLVIRGWQQQDRDEGANLVNQGVVIERDASKGEVLNSVKDANDARDNPTSNDLNRVCAKYDRNC